MKKIFLTLFLLLPLFALAHGGTDDAENIIRMTKNGFEPSELTVARGDEVLFINNDNVAHWPASNFHPTHTLYPEFDPKKGVPPGESWKFKFEKAGTWRMHDHLFPHLTGTIVVLKDEMKSAASSPEQTSENLGFWVRIKLLFLKLFRLKTPAQAMIMTSHDTAHLKGQLLFKEYGLDGLAFCTTDFAFGCYHGLMEVAFDKDHPENYEKNLAAAEKGCRKVSPETSPTYWSCIHGMGHGIITYREHDLSKALADCDILPTTIRTYCHDGVFMELSISAPPNFYKKSDPIYPCDAVGEDYKVACARSQVQVMRLRFGMDTRSIAATCEATAEDKIIFHCIDALGYFIGQSFPQDSKKIVSGCAVIADKAAALQCTAAAAGELVFQNSSGWQKKVKEVCQDDKACNERVEQVKKSYGRN